jgi:hypothetical protein
MPSLLVHDVVDGFFDYYGFGIVNVKSVLAGALDDMLVGVFSGE